MRVEALFFLVLVALLPDTGAATPIYAIRAAARCDGCHIEPIGWLDPADTATRKCTLDCNACHVNRTGGGMRTPAGEYFGREVLALWDLEPPPSSYGDPEKHRNQGETSTKGRYRLWEGFSGWHRRGTNPVPEMADRYGDIPPTPKLSFGLDARAMLYAPIGKKVSVFPMQLDGDAAWTPTPSWRAVTTVGLQGRAQRTVDDVNQQTKPSELFTIRELTLERSFETSNTYVRAGRFTKPYGWRHPDHTLAIRKYADYGQFAQVFGTEVGWNPNYPYANAAVFYQGIPSWPGERALPGAGVSFIAGFRDLGYQVGISGEALQLFESDTQSAERLLTTGPMIGINLYPLVLMTEADVRWRNSGADKRRELFIYNELNWEVRQGFTALFGFDLYRSQIQRPDTERARLIFGGQFDIVEHLQLATQYRLLYRERELLEKDFLMWVHLWL